MNDRPLLPTAAVHPAQLTPLLARRSAGALELKQRLSHAVSKRKALVYCTHCYRLQTTAQTGSFRRRSRRFEDNLLDNLDSNQADPRLSTRQPAKQDSPSQSVSQLDSATLPARRTKRKTLSQVQEDADDSKQQQQEAAADDWGWGYSGPTLATIGSNYEKKLQAPAGIAAQPAQQQVADDNWDHEEGMQDWADDESLPDDDLAEDEAPDVTLLNGNDVDQLLKLVPQQQQIQYYAGTPVDLGVRVGTGLVLTLAASKIPLLAAGTLFYPVWWPIYKAWSQNQKLRSQYRYVGMWRTKLLDLQADSMPGSMKANSYPSSLTFLIGNESSARTQISVPFNNRYEEIQIGESAELLLLSNTEDFSSFKALKEAYLPESGIWIAKYPFVDRDVFLDISLDIARSDQLLR